MSHVLRDWSSVSTWRGIGINAEAEKSRGRADRVGEGKSGESFERFVPKLRVQLF